MKTKVKAINTYYIVRKNGVVEYDTTNLFKALTFIGKSITGNLRGCLLVTVADAMAQGYRIDIKRF